MICFVKYFNLLYIQIFTNIYIGEKVMTEKNASLNIRLEESLIHDFRNMCEERGVVMSKVIRSLLTEELSKYEKWQMQGNSRGVKKNGR
jgi:hypothetical protein